MMRPAISSGAPRRPTGICGRIFEIKHLLGDRRHHLCADVPGRDGVYRHAFARDLERERFCKAMHSSLRRRVVGLPERALGAVDRRDVDDPPPTAVGHAVHDLLGHVERGIQVCTNDGVPIRLAHFLESRVLRDPGVIDQNVDLPRVFHDVRDAGFARVEIRNVDGIGNEVAPFLLVLGQPLFGLCVAGRVRYDHSVSGRMHLGADRFAKPTHSAGYDRHAHVVLPEVRSTAIVRP